MDQLTTLAQRFGAIKAQQTPLSKVIENYMQVESLFRRSLYEGSIGDFLNTAYKQNNLGNSNDPQDQINSLHGIIKMNGFNEFRNNLIHCRDLNANLITRIFDTLVANPEYVNKDLFIDEWTNIFITFFSTFKDNKRQRDEDPDSSKSKHALLKLRLLMAKVESTSLKILRTYGLLLIHSKLKISLFEQEIKIMAWLKEYILIEVDGHNLQIKDDFEAVIIEMANIPKTEMIKYYKANGLLVALEQQPVMVEDKVGLFSFNGSTCSLRVFHSNEEIHLHSRVEIKLLDF